MGWCVRVVLVCALVLASHSAVLDGAGVAVGEDDLRAAVEALRVALRDLEYGSDEYVELKASYTRKNIELKNLRWTRVGMEAEAYDALCHLEEELDELRNMPPSIIIELPEEDRTERLLEMRSLKQQITDATRPYRAAMKQLAYSERVREHPPPQPPPDGTPQRKQWDLDQSDPNTLENRELKRLRSMGGGSGSSDTTATLRPGAARGHEIGRDAAAHSAIDAEYESPHLHPDGPRHRQGGHNVRHPDDHHGRHHVVLPHQVEGPHPDDHVGHLMHHAAHGHGTPERTIRCSSREHIGLAKNFWGQWRVDPSKFAECTELHIIGQDLTDDEVEGIALALQYNDHLFEVNLHDNKISDAGMVSLAEALATDPAVQEVLLYHNAIGDMGVAALAQAIPKNKHLRLINLRHNQVTEAGFHVLADAVAELGQDGQLHHMELGQNPGSMKSQAYKDLVRMLRQTHEAAASLTAHGYLAHPHDGPYHRLDDHDKHGHPEPAA